MPQNYTETDTRGSIQRKCDSRAGLISCNGGYRLLDRLFILYVLTLCCCANLDKMCSVGEMFYIFLFEVNFTGCSLFVSNI